MVEKFKLTFFGGVGKTGGVNFLLEGAGKRILVDAGLANGCDVEGLTHMDDFKYDPRTVDYLFISHSHLENSGKIPKLIREGFKGVIYSTLETKELARLLLLDCFELEKESSDSKKIFFDKEDIDKAMSVWKTISYGEKIDLGDGLSVEMFDAGHILGSSLFNFSYNNKNLVFANSLGGQFIPSLSGMDKIKGIDYLVIESVYGDKSHDTPMSRRDYLEDIIERTVSRQGDVVVPVYSIDKIFVLLQDLKSLFDGDKVAKVPVVVFSSLAMKALGIYSKVFHCDISGCDTLDGFIENFGDLKFVSDNDFSEIDKIEGPKIIIGGMSMSRNQFVDNCLAGCMGNPNNSIVFVDYQLPGTLGRKLQEGLPEISIEDNIISVSAEVVSIVGYSSHADYNVLFKFIDAFKEGMRKVFTVIGEPKSSLYFAQRIKDYLGINALYPEVDKEYDLDF